MTAASFFLVAVVSEVDPAQMFEIEITSDFATLKKAEVIFNGETVRNTSEYQQTKVYSA